MMRFDSKKPALPPRVSVAGLGLVLLLGSASALASPEVDVVALAKANGCYSCHAMDEKVVGPAFKAVAAKYAGESGVAASLAQAIQNGSKGKWGRIPMPAHPGLSAEDLKHLSEWVAGLKP